MTEALTSLLDSTGNPDEAAHGIVNSPALIAEARALLPALKHAAQIKAGPEGVKAVIGRRFALYPQTQRSEGEAAAWWADYYDVLADVSLASLEAGMREWIRTDKTRFLPAPGQLRELAFTAPCRSLMRYYRAKRAVTMADDPPLAPVAPSPEDVAIIQRMAADLAQARDVANVKPALPSIAGKPDERGLTPQMREAMARRAEARQ